MNVGVTLVFTLSLRGSYAAGFLFPSLGEEAFLFVCLFLLLWQAEIPKP